MQFADAAPAASAAYAAEKRVQTQRLTHRADPYAPSILSRIANKVSSTLSSLSSILLAPTATASAQSFGNCSSNSHAIKDSAADATCVYNVPFMRYRHDNAPAVGDAPNHSQQQQQQRAGVAYARNGAASGAYNIEVQEQSLKQKQSGPLVSLPWIQAAVAAQQHQQQYEQQQAVYTWQRDSPSRTFAAATTPAVAAPVDGDRTAQNLLLQQQYQQPLAASLFDCLAPVNSVEGKTDAAAFFSPALSAQASTQQDKEQQQQALQRHPSRRNLSNAVDVYSAAVPCAEDSTTAAAFTGPGEGVILDSAAAAVLVQQQREQLALQRLCLEQMQQQQQQWERAVASGILAGERATRVQQVHVRPLGSPPPTEASPAAEAAITAEAALPCVETAGFQKNNSSSTRNIVKPQRTQRTWAGSSSLFSSIVEPAWLEPAFAAAAAHTAPATDGGRGQLSLQKQQQLLPAATAAPRREVVSGSGCGARVWGRAGAAKATQNSPLQQQQQEQLTVEQLQRLYMRCQPLHWRVRLRDLFRHEAEEAEVVASVDTALQRQLQKQQYSRRDSAATADVGGALPAEATQKQQQERARRGSSSVPPEGTDAFDTVRTSAASDVLHKKRLRAEGSTVSCSSSSSKSKEGRFDEAARVPSGERMIGTVNECIDHSTKSPLSSANISSSNVSMNASETAREARSSTSQQQQQQAVAPSARVGSPAQPSASFLEQDAASVASAGRQQRPELGSLNSSLFGTSSTSSTATSSKTQLPQQVDDGKTKTLEKESSSNNSDSSAGEGRSSHCESTTVFGQALDRSGSSLLGGSWCEKASGGKHGDTAASVAASTETQKGSLLAHANSLPPFGGVLPHAAAAEDRLLTSAKGPSSSTFLSSAVGNSSSVALSAQQQQQQDQQSNKAASVDCVPAESSNNSKAHAPPSASLFGSLRSSTGQQQQRIEKQPGAVDSGKDGETVSSRADAPSAAKETATTGAGGGGAAALPWWQQNLAKPCAVLPEEDFAPEADGEEEEKSAKEQQESTGLKPSFFNAGNSGTPLFGGGSLSTGAVAPLTASRSTPPTSTSLFGSYTAGKTLSSSASLFGDLKAAAAPATTSSIFGAAFANQNKVQQPQQPPVNSNQTAPLLFGSDSKTTAAGATAKEEPSSLFGGSIFGNPVAAKGSSSANKNSNTTAVAPPPAPASSSLFVFGSSKTSTETAAPVAPPLAADTPATAAVEGVNSTTLPNLFVFGAQQPPQQPPQQPTTSSNSSSTSGKRVRDTSDNNDSSKTPVAKSVFGGIATAPATGGGLFGQRPVAAGLSLFGAVNNASNSSRGEGARATVENSTFSTATGGGCKTPGASLFGAARSTTPVFGSSTSTSVSAGGGSLAASGGNAPYASNPFQLSGGGSSNTSNNNPFGMGSTSSSRPGGATSISSLFGGITNNSIAANLVSKDSTTGQSQPLWGAAGGGCLLPGGSNSSSNAAVNGGASTFEASNRAKQQTDQSRPFLFGNISGGPGGSSNSIFSNSSSNSVFSNSSSNSIFSNSSSNSIFSNNSSNNSAQLSSFGGNSGIASQSPFSFGAGANVGRPPQQLHQFGVGLGSRAAGGTTTPAPAATSAATAVAPAGAAASENSGSSFFGPPQSGVRRPRLTIKRTKQ